LTYGHSLYWKRKAWLTRRGALSVSNSPPWNRGSRGSDIFGRRGPETGEPGREVVYRVRALHQEIQP
jgi:hypothetical protein